MVPEPESQMAENGEVLGPEYDNGGVRSVRCDGEAQPSTAGDDPQECQGERVRRSLASRYG
jgi:hypothetical protein